MVPASYIESNSMHSSGQVKIAEDKAKQHGIDPANRPNQTFSWLQVMDSIVVTKRAGRRREEQLRSSKKRLGDAAGLTAIQRAIWEADGNPKR